MYPNLGVDDRSQFELIESLPGGIAGQKKLVSQMHARGVRVLYPYGMWDQGTRGRRRSYSRARTVWRSRATAAFVALQ